MKLEGQFTMCNGPATKVLSVMQGVWCIVAYILYILSIATDAANITPQNRTTQRPCDKNSIREHMDRLLLNFV